MVTEVLVNEIETESTSTGTCYTSIRSKTRQPASTPNYGYLVTTGAVLPVNPYVLNDTTVTQQVGSWPEPWTSSTSCFTHRGGGGFLQFPDSVEELITKAAGRATAGMYDNLGEGDFNAMVTAAELPKTMTLVAATAGRLAGAFKALKRFDVPSAFRSLGAGSGPHYRSLIRRSNSARRNAMRSGDYVRAGKDFAASSWLEVKYGWTPLLSEIHSGSEALANHLHKVDSSDHKAQGRGAAETGLVWTPSAGYKGAATGKRKVNCRYTIYSRIIDGQARATAGLGLTNPLSVGWELLPFSFVVDWFLPVGSFIDSLSATAGMSFTSGSLSIKVTEDIKASIHSTLYGGQWYSTPWPYQSNSFTFERQVLVDYPSRAKILQGRKSISEALNLNKATTALALLASVFK